MARRVVSGRAQQAGAKLQLTPLGPNREMLVAVTDQLWLVGPGGDSICHSVILHR